MARRYGAIVAINTDYFGTGHGPEGMAYVNGTLFHEDKCRTSSTISLDNRVDISREHSNGPGLKYTVVGGGPFLLANGNPVWGRGESDGCRRQKLSDLINRECYPG